MTESVPGQARLPGRREQAVRNDAVILQAAREVFISDPGAPIAAVAQRAGVGISALYRRYPSKEDLLRQLCHDGLRQFISIAEQAAGEPDGWEAFAQFLTGVVDADVHSLTVHLAGTFTPTAEMERDAITAAGLAEDLLRRAAASGRLRPGVVSGDITLVLEGCAAIRLPDRQRSARLRLRYLALLLDGLASHGGAALPGPPPGGEELNWRWRRDGPARKLST
ncbi:MAG TPA: helix-turn-helix domain-containing protein [Streptosporangiaceae bacterium]|nr:helix-turn-helix domain-containing protein [Streptosporangiaceae bacterium]